MTFNELVSQGPLLAAGAGMTALLTLGCVLVSLTVGILMLVLQLAGGSWGKWIGRIYVSLMRGTPLLVQLFVVFFGLPLLGLGGKPLLAATLAIGGNSGAYVSEILRGAVLNIPVGQVEAAQTVGLSPRHIWRRVILPQAFVTSLPALTNEFTIVLKSTPLASVVAVTELTYQGQLIISRTYQPTEILLTVSVFYVLLALSLTRVSRWLEQRLSRLQGSRLPLGRSYAGF